LPWSRVGINLSRYFRGDFGAGMVVADMDMAAVFSPHILKVLAERSRVNVIGAHAQRCVTDMHPDRVAERPVHVLIGKPVGKFPSPVSTILTVALDGFWATPHPAVSRFVDQGVKGFPAKLALLLIDALGRAELLGRATIKHLAAARTRLLGHDVFSSEAPAEFRCAWVCGAWGVSDPAPAE